MIIDDDLLIILMTLSLGMYSAEDIQQDYQYSESAKPGSYQPAVYGYQQPQDIAYSVDNYQRYEEVLPATVHQVRIFLVRSHYYTTFKNKALMFPT